MSTEVKIDPPLAPESQGPGTPEEEAADHAAWKADERAMLDTFHGCAELISKRLGADTVPDGFDPAMRSRRLVLTALGVLFDREVEEPPSAFDEMIRAFTKSFATPQVGEVIAKAYMDLMKPSPLPSCPPIPKPEGTMTFMSLTAYIRTLPKGELEKLATLIRDMLGEPEGGIKA